MFGIGSASGSVIGLALWESVGTRVWLICGVACLFGMAAGWLGIRQTPAEQPQPTSTEGKGDG
jgi:hypothetical protein